MFDSLRTSLPLATVAATLALTAAQAHAVDRYGVATSAGGFDTDAYHAGAYDGTLTDGRFVDVVGFAVDTRDATPGGDGTALYVLDRVSGVNDDTTRWRLQKLDSDGRTIAQTRFSLPNDDFGATATLRSLAVDGAGGRLYALVTGAGLDQDDNPIAFAREVIAFSTTPSAGKLVGAAGLTADALTTPDSGYTAAGVLSGESTLVPGGTPLIYRPAGIAIAGSGGATTVALAGAATTRGEDGGRVVGLSPTDGATGTTWSTLALAGLPNAAADEGRLAVTGIGATPDGRLDVVLGTSSAAARPSSDLVRLDSALANPTVLSSPGLIGDNWLGAPLFTIGKQLTGNADVVTLSNGLVAATFRDYTGSAFWSGFDGVRLIAPRPNGLLAAPGSPTTIFDTLGSVTAGEPCSIPALQRRNRLALAAGANGTVWALVGGPDTGLDRPNSDGRQLIEYAPGAATTCLGASGTFTVGGNGAGAPAPKAASVADPLTITAGTTVAFDAGAVAYPGGGRTANVYAYAWNLTGATRGGPGDDGFTEVSAATSAANPPATTTRTYTAPGSYDVALRITGDFGSYERSGRIVVQSTEPPTAALAQPVAIVAGESAQLDGSGSSAAFGHQLVNYRWSWGDGSSADDTASPRTSHRYAAAGTYTVTLRVRDESGQTSTAATRQVTVNAPAPPGDGGGRTPGGGTTPPPPTTTPAPAPRTQPLTPRVSVKTLGGRGALRLRLALPAGSPAVTGTIKLTYTTKVTVGRGKKARARTQTIAVGSGAYTLRAGRSATVTLFLNKTGAAWLKRRGSLKLSVVVAARGSDGGTSTKTVTATVTRAAAARRGGRR